MNEKKKEEKGKIIPFPGPKYYPSLGNEQIQECKNNLLYGDVQEQWNAFERLGNYAHPEILTIIQDFLLEETKDDLLKTKLLQKLKIYAPNDLHFTLVKHKQKLEISLKDVPLSTEDWEELCFQPIKLLEQTADDNPTLLAMSYELWLLYLEKTYPFQPRLEKQEEIILWAAALHAYILYLIDQEEAENLLLNTFPERYSLPIERIMLQCKKLQRELTR